MWAFCISEYSLCYGKSSECSLMNTDDLLKQIERLEAENKKLTEIAIDATERIEAANDLAENYQKMFDQLFQVIKTQYDAEFTLEDIPKHLS